MKYNYIPLYSDNFISLRNFIILFIILIISLTLYFVIDLILNKFLNLSLSKKLYDWNDLILNTNIYFINNLLSIIKNFVYFIHEIFNPYFSIKTIGRQWYRSREYPEFNNYEINCYTTTSYATNCYKNLPVARSAPAKWKFRK